MRRRPHVLLTGATGGIGEALARRLASCDCDLTLVAREPARLALLADDLRRRGTEVLEIARPLGRGTPYDELVQHAIACSGPVDLLINNAAINWFGHFATMPDAQIDDLIDVNVAAPIHLCRAVLPSMLGAGRGTIVNIGSVFGSVAFAGFPVYSASKFALRGFSQGLRRELKGRNIDILYIAPRYTRTGFNSGAVESMARATGMHIDEPEAVADRILAAIAERRSETVIGRGESVLAKLNALLPGLIDRVLSTTTDKILRFAPGGPYGLVANKENRR
jgi:short-subunit dehydrogenase